MRTQTEMKELLAVYEQELAEREEAGKPVSELIPLVEFIRAQIVEEVPIEQPSDPEPGDPEPSQLEE